MKRYSTLPKAPELPEPHHQMQFSIIIRTLVRSSYPSAEMQSVYSTVPTYWGTFSGSGVWARFFCKIVSNRFFSTQDFFLGNLLHNSTKVAIFFFTGLTALHILRKSPSFSVGSDFEVKDLSFINWRIPVHVFLFLWLVEIKVAKLIIKWKGYIWPSW